MITAKWALEKELKLHTTGLTTVFSLQEKQSGAVKSCVWSSVSTQPHSGELTSTAVAFSLTSVSSSPAWLPLICTHLLELLNSCYYLAKYLIKTNKKTHTHTPNTLSWCSIQTFFLWHFSVWAWEEKCMMCPLIWTNPTGHSHPEKREEQEESVPGSK